MSKTFCTFFKNKYIFFLNIFSLLFLEPYVCSQNHNGFSDWLHGGKKKKAQRSLVSVCVSGLVGLRCGQKSAVDVGLPVSHWPFDTKTSDRARSVNRPAAAHPPPITQPPLEGRGRWHSLLPVRDKRHPTSAPAARPLIKCKSAQQIWPRLNKAFSKFVYRCSVYRASSAAAKPQMPFRQRSGCPSFESTAGTVAFPHVECGFNCLHLCVKCERTELNDKTNISRNVCYVICEMNDLLPLSGC